MFELMIDMSKPICSACGGTIENPKSVVLLPDDITLCLSCYESERTDTYDPWPDGDIEYNVNTGEYE